MNKLILLFHLIIVPLHVDAQNRNNAILSEGNYECLYEYKVVAKNGQVDNYSTILQIGINSARFVDYSQYEVDSVSFVENATLKEKEKFNMQLLRNDMFFDQTVYQNNPKGKLSIFSIITPDFYKYEEDSHPIKWTLSEETDTVCGYVCKKATGMYGGFQWIAWYAPQITVSFGPWKFCGLPGLILAAHDTENTHKFEAIVFRKSSVPIPNPDNSNTISTTRDKFIKAKNVFEENPLQNIPVESVGEMTVRKFDGEKSSILINGVQLRIHPNGYTPLEKE